jgi:hypothetical protein
MALALQRLVLLFVFLAVAPCGYCSAQELPPEALALVKEFEKETAAAKQRYGEEIARWRQRVTEKLTAVKKRLADEDRLEEAILVRDVAKVFSTGWISPSRSRKSNSRRCPKMRRPYCWRSNIPAAKATSWKMRSRRRLRSCGKTCSRSSKS